jgi:RNA polymerase sigma-70 factor (ECF subfamily)
MQGIEDATTSRTVNGVIASVTAQAPPAATPGTTTMFSRGGLLRSRATASRYEKTGTAAPPRSPEQALVDRARGGESDAFDALFLRYKDGVYACLWNLLDGDADLVEEAVGSVFLSAYRSLARFRGDAAFSTWLYRIAVNEAYARRRQKRRWMRFGMVSLNDQMVAPAMAEQPDNDPADFVLRSEQDRRLRQAVSVLPEPYKTPVVLRYLNGMDSTEISAVLGRPAGTVRYQLSRALHLLRERLGSEWPL